MTIGGEKTLVRKSPNLNIDTIDLGSTPMRCSRPTFSLDLFTLSLVRDKGQDGGNPSVIVLESLPKQKIEEGAPITLQGKGKKKVDLAKETPPTVRDKSKDGRNSSVVVVESSKKNRRRCSDIIKEKTKRES